MDIAQLVTCSVKQGASDLHLSAGVEPMIRVDGDVKRINLPALEHKNVHDMVYDIMNDKQRKAWDEFLDTDFSFEIPGLARFRRSEEHTSELQSLMRISYAVFCYTKTMNTKSRHKQ